jgi:hypothetical protein
MHRKIQAKTLQRLRQDGRIILQWILKKLPVTSPYECNFDLLGLFQNIFNLSTLSKAVLLIFML